MRKILDAIIKKYVRFTSSSLLRETHPYYQFVDHDNFDNIYKKGLARTDTPFSIFRRDRFFNLFNTLELVKYLPGDMAECGSWKGLSAYIICSKRKAWDPQYNGHDFMIIDSFEGLSKPLENEKIPYEYKGKFAADIQNVRHSLEEFPNIAFIKGWIPPVLDSLPEKKYRFVHIDVDLVEPTTAAMRYFYERLYPGGIIVCDDYGSKDWATTKQKVDELLQEKKIPFVALSTGQLLLFKNPK